MPKPLRDLLASRATVSPGIAGELARTLWGVTGAVKPLPGERDANFAIGDTSILKISESGASPDRLAFEESLARAVEAADPDLRVIQPVPLPEGSTGTLREFAGVRHVVRLFPRLPGIPISRFRRRPPALLRAVGELVARLQLAFGRGEGISFVSSDIPWNPLRFGEVIESARPMRNPDLFGRVAEEVLRALPRLEDLPQAFLHNDLNDDNLLLEGDPEEATAERLAVLDFGDAVRGPRIMELATAAFYLSIGTPDPLRAAEAVLRSSAGLLPVLEAEADLFRVAITSRALVSAAMSASRQETGEAYLFTSEEGAWRFLDEIARTPGPFLDARFRNAAGFAPPRSDPALLARGAVPPIAIPEGAKVLDLGPESPAVDPADPIGSLGAHLPEGVSIGRYREPRLLYRGPAFHPQAVAEATREPRTIHLGIDVFAPAGTPVVSPLDGEIAWLRDDAVPFGFGSCLAIRHEGGFETLYGHLGRKCLTSLEPGQRVRAGERFAALGSPEENGGWPPHLHFQVLAFDLGFSDDPPGVASAGDLETLEAMSPNPAAFLGLDPEAVAVSEEALEEPRHLLAARGKRISPVLSLTHDPPIPVVRGRETFLYDNLGRDYLDMVNNVCHVGHAHPRVAEAIARQVHLLNTNTRYLYRQLTDYAEELAATFPEPLRVVFFTNSGSEANDLALRLARRHLGRDDTIVFDGGYHGNLTSLIEISPYKLDGPGGIGSGGPGPHSRLTRLPMPDGFRGRFRRGAPEWREKLIADARDQVKAAGPATLIAEAILSCGGQIVPPRGYLASLYRAVRENGGVIVADEVQTGFGRVGPAFWAFCDVQEEPVEVPDIVTVGKPAGNGHPLGAVITTPRIAASFENGMEYFNTFGGNPVSCAAGLAVMQVIREEGLAEHAREVGNRLRDGLSELGRSFPILAEARGRGLFLGFELAHPGDPPMPARREASRLVNRLYDFRILNSTDGPDGNVIKLKPPLTFSNADADRYLETLDFVLREQLG